MKTVTVVGAGFIVNREVVTPNTNPTPDNIVEQCRLQGMNNTKLSAEELRQIKISIPSLEHLVDYLNYQYPATAGDIELSKLCKRISALDAEIGELRDNQRVARNSFDELANRSSRQSIHYSQLEQERDQLKAENEELKKQNGGISIICEENDQLRAQLEQSKADYQTEYMAKKDVIDMHAKEVALTTKLSVEIQQLHAQVAEMRDALLDFKVASASVTSLRPGSEDAFAKAINKADKIRCDKPGFTSNQTVIEWIGLVIDGLKKVVASDEAAIKELSLLNIPVDTEVVIIIKEQLSRLTKIREQLEKGMK